MGYCKDCYNSYGWYYKLNHITIFDKYIYKDTPEYGFCSVLSGRKVKQYDSCNRFVAELTEDDVEFTGSSGSDGCYLTAALVNYLGKSDDCQELNTLRKFRDDYMKNTPEGEKLVKEYYIIAPLIVENIDESPKKDEYYKYILNVVNECCALINAGQLSKTQEKYVEMVLHFKNELLQTENKIE